MRAVGILIVLALAAAAAVWWLDSDPVTELADDARTDGSGTKEERAGLAGRATELIADGASIEGSGSEAIRGIVEDVDGNPLPGILVELEAYQRRGFEEDRPGAWFRPDRLGHPHPSAIVATTRSGEDGQFMFRGVPRTGAGVPRSRRRQAAVVCRDTPREHRSQPLRTSAAGCRHSGAHSCRGRRRQWRRGVRLRLSRA